MRDLFSCTEAEDQPTAAMLERPLGLYVHLPFCRTKCTYCAFVSGAPRSEGEMDAYAEALLKHLRAGSGQVQGRAVTSVFFGGGTPSLMGPQRMGPLLEAIQSHYPVAPDAEITIEANPESATTALFERLRPLGLNRVSLGAQSFDDEELQRLGRVHSAGEVERAIHRARQAGIENVSIDLIFGLPGQTMTRWQNTVRRALQCPITHLSAYALSFEEGTLLHRQWQHGNVTAAPDETYIGMYDHLCARLQEAGWQHYEISNWCVPGYACQHNQVYWQRDDYLAFGVSAHGLIHGTRYGLIRDPREYMRQVNELDGALHQTFLHPALLDEKTVLTSAEAASDGMIFGLRLARGVDLAAFEARYGIAPLEHWQEAIEALRADGSLVYEDGCLRLAREQYLLSNNILVHFLD